MAQEKDVGSSNQSSKAKFSKFHLSEINLRTLIGVEKNPFKFLEYFMKLIN